jgi:DNA processing protein
VSTAPPDPPPGWRGLGPTDRGYPRLLLETSPAPPLLARGELDADAEMVAVVGSRRCSLYGEDVAFEIGAGLAAAGVVVVSGLARGVDAAAHRGALSVGGRTIAVMGTGPDTIYPRVHRQLAEQVAASGALVTQFPAGTQPLPRNFPIRNAVISGLSLGVVVVEAGVRSGAMLTAGSAGDQGRAVMAVPGSVRNPGSAGCHALIRDGARLVTSAEDVIREVRTDPLFRLLTVAPVRTPAYGDLRDRVLELLEADALTIDEVCAATKRPAQEVALALASLRLDGRVALREGCYAAVRNRAGPRFGIGGGGV